MPHSPHTVTRIFEAELAKYTGAPYAVAVNSCSMALLLAVAWHFRKTHPRHRHEYNAAWSGRRRVEIPKRTYVSVPQSIIWAGGRPEYRDENWVGAYQLKPLPVWDSARWLTSNLYREVADGDGFVCVSFHATKTLGDSQGGAILHNSPEADIWLRKARFDGRTEGIPPKDDKFDMVGWHCYLSPDVSARLLWRMAALPKHNDPLPNDAYPDLSEIEAFQ